MHGKQKRQEIRYKMLDLIMVLVRKIKYTIIAFKDSKLEDKAHSEESSNPIKLIHYTDFKISINHYYEINRNTKAF